MARRIIDISGTDARSFLQGLVTNDLGKLDQGLVYAALLTPQGKYMADFFLLAQGDSILLDADESLGDMLMQRLGMYRLRADVQLAESDLRVRRGTGEAPEGALADPRHPALGWRLYGSDAGDDGSDFDAIRVAHCIPETGSAPMGTEITGGGKPVGTLHTQAGSQAIAYLRFDRAKGDMQAQEATVRLAE